MQSQIWFSPFHQRLYSSLPGIPVSQKMCGKQAAGHWIREGFLWNGSHYSSCDWDRTGKKVNGSGQDRNHNNKRSVFLHKYAVLIQISAIFFILNIMLVILLFFCLLTALVHEMCSLLTHGEVTKNAFANNDVRNSRNFKELPESRV